MATLDEDDYKRLQALAADVHKTQTIVIVHTTLEAMGMDVKNPLTMQKDFAHLRGDRINSEDTSKSIKDTFLRWGTMGVIGAVAAWLATHFNIGGGGQ